ncbi:MAG: glycosyltransferase family 9 protein [Elusimicrobiota bacterium]|jgi:ADP-heptose:LPS heptosyltransferase|nr:glycosyltransferase family 9 protein [Elusimicrobiota bacterium]
MGKINNLSREIRRKIAAALFDKRRKYKKDLDIKNSKSFLLLLPDDKIGDMVINTLSFREIKKLYPELKILVLCGKNSAEIIKYNPNIDEVLEIYGKFQKDFAIYKDLRKRKIDIALDLYEFDLKPLRLLSLRIIAPHFLIGLHKKKYKTFDFSIEGYFFDKHITQRHRCLLNVLGIENPSLNYDVFIGAEEEKAAQEYIQKAQDKIMIVVNPFAASKHRSFEFEKLKELISLIKNSFDCAVFILCPQNKRAGIAPLENENEKIFICSFKSILSAAALIEKSALIISPDTSIVHIASAFQKKTIALYLDFSNRQEKTDIIWGPNNPNAFIINVDSQKGLLKNDIYNIANSQIIEAAKYLLRRQNCRNE